MQRPISNQQFEAARAAYTHFAIQAAFRLANEVGFSYEPMGLAPETATAVQASYDLSMTERLPFPVWNGASDHTVFIRPEGNYAFRFWHDVVSHGAHGLGFGVEDEVKAGMQWVDRVAREFGAQSVEAMIAYADTVLQTRYAEEHGEFPEDQLAFVRYSLGIGSERAPVVPMMIESQRAALAVAA